MPSTEVSLDCYSDLLPKCCKLLVIGRGSSDLQVFGGCKSRLSRQLRSKRSRERGREEVNAWVLKLEEKLI